ncbi:MAG: YjbF family lipoprotein [Shimia sp.]
MTPRRASTMRTARPVLCALLCLVLALPLGSGAALAQGDPDNGAMRRAAQAFVQSLRREPPPQFTATRAQLAAQGLTGPLLKGAFGVAPGNRSAGFLGAGRVGALRVWRATDTATLYTTDDGVLRATVGLGFDLYTAETDAVAAALAAGGGRYARTLRHLDAEHVLRPMPVTCTMTRRGAETVTVLGRAHATMRLEETCTTREAIPQTGAPLRFVNVYNRDPRDGLLWRSSQWVSLELGHIALERINR